ncbi:hypothetical protein DSECCO2_396840 [anaerobic digester metagenome]
MLESGYIRLYRSFLTWEWYSDSTTKNVFLHLILTANWEPKKWKGITVERGQRVYSRASLAREMRLSERNIRTALNHLISTGEVTNQTTTQYSIITIKNYDLYQQPTSEATNDRPTTDQRPTIDRPQLKKDKESKKDKKDKYIGAFTLLSGDDEELRKAFSDFESMRIAKKRPLTDRAEQMIVNKLKGMGDRDVWIASLNQSTLNAWQDVFPPKTQTQQRGKRKSWQDIAAEMEAKQK